MKTNEENTSSDASKFLINSAYQGFNDRQKNVFDQLNIVEHSTKNLLTSNEPLMDVEEPPDNDVVPETIISSRLSKHEAKIKHFRGSIFKRPHARPPRSLLNRKVPDYQVNPHRWTRYSLDVPDEDMSDRTNTGAAMSFLKELKLRKQAGEALEGQGELSQKIVFKKTPLKKTDVEKAPVTATIFQNTKMIMPEYVVGQKMKKERKQRKIIDGSSTQEIKLDHLFENEDD